MLVCNSTFMLEGEEADICRFDCFVCGRCSSADEW